MDVRLKVVQGKPLGKQFRLPTSRFVIGRADDCHLKPNSDLVDSHQCAIVNEGGEVRVQHLGQANGTHVNGAAIQGEVVVKSGDLLQVGPLVFAFDLFPTTDDTKSQKPAPESPAAPPLDKPLADHTNSGKPSGSAKPQAAASSAPEANQVPADEEAELPMAPSPDAENEEEVASVFLDADVNSAPASEAPAKPRDAQEKAAPAKPETPSGVANVETQKAAAEAPASAADIEEPVLDAKPERTRTASPPAPKKKDSQSTAETGEDGDVLDWLMDGDEPEGAGEAASGIPADGSPVSDASQPGESQQPTADESNKKESIGATSNAAADILRKWSQGGQQ